MRPSPGPGVWSALEYAAHVSQLFDVFDGRVRAALAGRRPTSRWSTGRARGAAAAPALDREATAEAVDDAADSLATTLSELNATSGSSRR